MSEMSTAKRALTGSNSAAPAAAHPIVSTGASMVDLILTIASYWAFHLAGSGTGFHAIGGARFGFLSGETDDDALGTADTSASTSS